MPILEAVVPDNIVEGSAEWDLAEAAITAASTGQLAWVRNASTTINAIQIGAQGPLPYPDLIERMVADCRAALGRAQAWAHPP